MIENFDEIRKQLGELAPIINSFKSEAVQLRVVDLIFAACAKSSPADEHVEVDPEPSSKRKTVRRRAPAKPASGATDAVTPKKTGRIGGHAMLSQLVAGSFFKTARTIGAMVEHCETNLAARYKQSDFSGPLIRLVREQTLKRTKNADGQYEYSNA